MPARFFIVIGFSYMYGFFEVFMNVRSRSKGTVATSGDKGSLWLLYGLITLGYAMSFAVGATRNGRMHSGELFFAIGSGLAAIGLMVRVQSILTLRQYFTYSVAKIEGHSLIDKGLYAHIRHPGYLGQLLIFTGISIALSNWLSILFMMLPVMIGYGYRIKVEEQFMLEQLGEKYATYQKRTNRIIPLLY
jgi:protein-S-isoprenylcysteine O-methyltransferase Ste14